MSWLEKTMAYYNAFGFPAVSLVKVIGGGDMVQFEKILAYAEKYHAPSVLEQRDDEEGIKPLAMAFYKKRTSMLLRLLEVGVNPDAILAWSHENTILHYACTMGRNWLIRLFLLYGANYNEQRDKTDMNALMLARTRDQEFSIDYDRGTEGFLVSEANNIARLHQYKQRGEKAVSDGNYRQAIESFRLVAEIYWGFAEDEKRQARERLTMVDFSEEHRLLGEHYYKHAFINHKKIHDCYVELMKVRFTEELREEYVRFLTEVAGVFEKVGCLSESTYFRNAIETVGVDRVVVAEAEETDVAGSAEQYGLRLRRKGEYQEIPGEPACDAVAGHGV